MQHISEILPRTMRQLPPLLPRASRADHTSSTAPSPTNLHELIGVFEAQEARENPDATVPLRTLTMTEDDTLLVPDRGDFTFTDWSRKQCASLLGIRWDRWFENANPRERADELNRRFARANGSVKVRTRRAADADAKEHGEVTALVSLDMLPSRTHGSVEFLRPRLPQPSPTSVSSATT